MKLFSFLSLASAWTTQQAAAPCGRRAAVAAAGALLTSALPKAAAAYDSVPGPSGVPSAKARTGGQLDYKEAFGGGYGAPPPAMGVGVDPEKLAAERTKKRKEREAKAAAKNAEAQGLVAKIASAETAQAFADATDELSLWIIAQGKPLPPPGGPWADILQASPLPEGFRTRELIEAVKVKRSELPRVARGCEKTRDNNGARHMHGPP